MKAAHVLTAAAVLAAAGLVISLGMTFRSGPPAHAGHAVVTRTSAAVSPAAGSPAMAGLPALAGPAVLAAGPGKATARSAAARPSASAMPAASAMATAPAASTAPPGSTAPSASTMPAASSSAPAASAGASLAGRIQPGVTYDGVATEYSAGDGDGACTFGPAADLMIAAMNYTDYETAKACGDYVLVQAANGASVTVLITNECPLPCAPGQLDLSQQAFAKIADPAAGRVSVTWKLLSPALSSTISVRYKTGSSQWWCGIQVIGHRNPVALLEVQAGNGWQQLPRAEYNYFLSTNGSGCGGPIRITDIYGEQLTINGIGVQPDVVQPTQVQFAQHAGT